MKNSIKLCRKRRDRRLALRGLLEIVLVSFLATVGIFQFANVKNATASAGWTSPKSIDVVSLGKPDIDTDPQGNTVAVFSSADGSDSRMTAVSRTPGEDWTNLEYLSPAGQYIGVSRVDAGADGAFVVVWEQSDGNNMRIRVAYRTDQDGWQDVGYISPAGSNADEPRVDISENGNVAIGWLQFDGSSYIANVVVGAVGDTLTIGEPVAVSQPGYSASISEVAVADDGFTVALWTVNLADGDGDRVYSSKLLPGAAEWGGPQAVTDPGDYAYQPVVEMNADGDAVALWRLYDDPVIRIRSAELDSSDGDLWGSFQFLSGEDVNAYSPSLAVDPEGGIAAIWSADYGQARTVQASVKTGQVWFPALEIATTSAYEPEIAVSPSGDLVSAWHMTSGFDSRVQAATLTAGDIAWSAPELLSGQDSSAGEPSLASDGEGNAVSIWEQGGSLRVATYDVTDPEISDIKVPSYLAAGEEATFSVDAFDAWSDATVSWDFGDGSSATGEEVAHTYSEPGSYEVKVTVTDEVGNSVSDTETMEVSAAENNENSGGGNDGSQGTSGSSSSESSGSGGSSSGGSGGGPGTSTTNENPKLSKLKVSRKKISKRMLRKMRRGKKKLYLRFKLSEDAKVSFEIRKKLKRCSKRKSKKSRRRCRKGKRVARFTKKAKEGKNKTRLSRSVVKKLKRGTYTIKAQAKDYEGAKSKTRRTVLRVSAK